MYMFLNGSKKILKKRRFCSLDLHYTKKQVGQTTKKQQTCKRQQQKGLTTFASWKV